ncbi:MAG: hypothetical protein ACPG8W_17660 [Candidatus Promineifilaceae bacterium]
MNQLHDQQLLMYLNGTASAETVLEISTHPEHYSTQLALLKTQQTLLGMQLAAHPQPTIEELVDHSTGQLPHAEQRRLTTLIATNPFWQRTFAEYQEFMHATAPAIPEKAANQTLIGRVLRVLTARLQSPLTTIRSSAELPSDAVRRLNYEVEQFDIALMIAAEPDRPGHLLLSGDADVDDEGENESEQLTVDVWRKDPPRKVASTTVDEDGFFEIGTLLPDVYDLILHTPQVQIHLHDVPLHLTI